MTKRTYEVNQINPKFILRREPNGGVQDICETVSEDAAVKLAKALNRAYELGALDALADVRAALGVGK